MPARSEAHPNGLDPQEGARQPQLTISLARDLDLQKIASLLYAPFRKENGQVVDVRFPVDRKRTGYLVSDMSTGERRLLAKPSEDRQPMDITTSGMIQGTYTYASGEDYVVFVLPSTDNSIITGVLMTHEGITRFNGPVNFFPDSYAKARDLAQETLKAPKAPTSGD